MPVITKGNTPYKDIYVEAQEFPVTTFVSVRAFTSLINNEFISEQWVLGGWEIPETNGRGSLLGEITAMST